MRGEGGLVAPVCAADTIGICDWGGSDEVKDRSEGFLAIMENIFPSVSFSFLFPMPEWVLRKFREYSMFTRESFTNFVFGG